MKAEKVTHCLTSSILSCLHGGGGSCRRTDRDVGWQAVASLAVLVGKKSHVKWRKFLEKLSEKRVPSSPVSFHFSFDLSIHIASLLPPFLLLHAPIAPRIRSLHLPKIQVWEKTTEEREGEVGKAQENWGWEVMPCLHLKGRKVGVQCRHMGEKGKGKVFHEVCFLHTTHHQVVAHIILNKLSFLSFPSSLRRYGGGGKCVAETRGRLPPISTTPHHHHDTENAKGKG